MAGHGRRQRHGRDRTATSPSRPSSADGDDSFPTKQLTILAICRFAEPIAFDSILAYSYVMVRDLQDGDETNASFYAGLLVSAYAVAEALTAMWWGALSDRIGRKPVILSGLVGVGLSCIIFGLAKNYWVALLARFIGGCLNGNVGVMQTAVMEMVKKPEHEPRAYATQPFIWTVGTIMGSAMGGFLAQPAVFYPTVFAPDGIFGRYPYLLPNLVCVVVIIIAVTQGIFFLEETNPYAKDQSQEKVSVRGQDPSVITETTPLCRVSANEMVQDATMEPPNKYTTVETIREIRDAGEPQGPKNPAPRMLTFPVAMTIFALIIAAYHCMAFHSIVPIYLLDQPSVTGTLDLVGGLGYSLHDVGVYLSINGFLVLFIQGVVLPPFVEKFGVWTSFIWMIIIWPIPYMLIPLLTLMPPAILRVGIYGFMILPTFCNIVMNPCGLILLKNACPSPQVLGRLNGLAMSSLCFARVLASPVVGTIYDHGGSAAAWLSLSFAAALGVLQMFWIPREAACENTDVLEDEEAAILIAGVVDENDE